MAVRRYLQERVEIAGGGSFIRLLAFPAPQTPQEMQEVLAESERITRETGMIVVADVRDRGGPESA